MIKHLGIVGVSPEGAALFYRQLSRHAARLLPPDRHPCITIHNEPLSRYIDAIRKDDWHAVGDLLRASAEILARAGAKICMTPDNIVQHGVYLAESNCSVPWLTMTDLVARAVESEGRSCVGVIGTKLVTRASTYQTHLGLKGVRVLAPDDREVDLLDEIIFGELIYGAARPESRAAIHAIINSLAARGAEGVIIASSEIPGALDPDASAVRLYDAGDILAEGAIRAAAAK